MQTSSAKPSSVSPSASPAAEWTHRVGAVIGLLAVSLWMGGLVALGALAAPVVFAIVPFPSSADAMTLVFRRFDDVAMACGAVLLATEAARALARPPPTRLDHGRVVASALAALAAVVEATRISPRIAELHAAGVVRGASAAGAALSRLHDEAEMCGKVELALLVAVVALQVAALSRARGRAD